MKFRSGFIRILKAGLIVWLFCWPVFGQDQPDVQRILGEWDVEVDAGEEFYYLTLVLEKAEGELRGAISEDAGYFSDIPLENIVYDGETLMFEFMAPTPPDGFERVISCEFFVNEDKMQGTMTVSELGVSVVCTATRKK